MVWKGNDLVEIVVSLIHRERVPTDDPSSLHGKWERLVI